MTNYAQHLKSVQTEQDKPSQVKNSAGGYSFKLDKWRRLERFLILGNEGGTYYAGERKLTRENATCVQQCILEDGPCAVKLICEISEAGRAPKNDPAIFALAMCAAATDPQTREFALGVLPRVCRIGTHLFHFFSAVNEMRGWGRGLKKAMAGWYLDKPVDKLAHELLKYQQRDGVSHRDVLRMAHPRGTQEYVGLFKYATRGTDIRAATKRKLGMVAYPEVSIHPMHVAYEEMKAATSSAHVIELIGEYGFTHEMVPSQWKDNPSVWAALLDKMPITATIRNLGKMSAVGLLKPFSAAAKMVVARLTDVDVLKRGKVHPIQLLSALTVYEQGHGERGSLSWSAIPQVIDALDDAFYKAFDLIEPTGKNMLLALDVSGSMDGGVIAGVPGLTPRMASAAMAMVTARSEKNYLVVGFTSRSGNGGGRWGGDTTALAQLTISPKMRLDDVCKYLQQIPMGGTDCALPMLWATKDKLDVDCFAIYTDNETWAGKTHPHVALEEYRRKMSKQAKLVVVGMTATEFTVADPNDAGSMDVVGFDSAAPAVISDFVRS